MDRDQAREASETPPGWSRPIPATLPHPTYWPAVLGLGVAFVGWGLATQLAVAGVGMLLVAIAAAGLIVDLVLESMGNDAG